MAQASLPSPGPGLQTLDPGLQTLEQSLQTSELKPGLQTPGQGF